MTRTRPSTSTRHRVGRGLLKAGWIGLALVTGLWILVSVFGSQTAETMLALAAVNPLLVLLALGPGLAALTLAPEARTGSAAWGVRALLVLLVSASAAMAALAGEWLTSDTQLSLAIVLATVNAALLVLANLWGWGGPRGDPRARSYASLLALAWAFGALVSLAGAGFLLEALPGPATFPYRAFVILTLLPTAGPLWATGRAVQLILYATRAEPVETPARPRPSSPGDADPFQLDETS